MGSIRYTPFLDGHGITLKDSIPDQAASIIDSALHAIENMIDWGSWEGKQRLPCPEQPVLLSGLPLGQYHCPVCGMMLLAGLPHLSPAAPPDRDPLYPMDDYEIEYGSPGHPALWPPGYKEADGADDAPVG